MTPQDARAALRAHAQRLMEALEKATPGVIRYDSSKHHAMNQRLESAEVVPMDNGRLVASLFITAWKQGHRDARPNARLMELAWNSARAAALAFETLADWHCDEHCEEIPEVTDCVYCRTERAALVLVAEMLSQ